MAKRITILLDNDIDKKLRSLQGQEIIKTQKSVSYSYILNKILRKSLQ